MELLRRRFNSLLVLPLLAVMLGGGCKYAKSLWESASRSEPALAQVGRDVVTESDFIDYVNRLSPGYRAQAVSPQQRRQTLDSILSQKAIAELGRQAGVEQDPEYIKSMKHQAESALTQLYMDRLRMKQVVSNDEISTYYKAHLQEFKEGSVQASHIVTASLADAQKAQELLASGKPFTAVAKTMSIDRDSAGKGGKLAPVRIGQPPSIRESVLISLQKGKHSAPLQTAAGYELIRKDDDMKGSPAPLENVEKEIRSKLQSQKAYKELEDAKLKLIIKIDQKRLDALVIPK